MGEVGKWRQRGERRKIETVEEKSSLEEKGKRTSKEKYFPSPPLIFFLIEANSANQNAEY